MLFFTKIAYWSLILGLLVQAIDLSPKEPFNPTAQTLAQSQPAAVVTEAK